MTRPETRRRVPVLPVRRVLTAVGLAVTAVLLLAGPASAHPLGNSSTNLHSGLRVEPEQLVVDHVVDLAEIRTVQLLAEADADADGSLDPQEASRAAERACRGVSATASVRVDGRPTGLVPGASDLVLAPGQGGLQVARLTCTLSAPLALEGPTRLDYRDDTFPDRFGWREVTAVGDGTTLLRSDVPTASPSARLTRYPEAATADIPDVRSASLEVRPGGPRLGAAAVTALPGGAFAGPVDRVTQAFYGLVGRQELTLGFGVLAALIAVVLGSGHALAPGHGKTVMAAYLVGQEGTPRRALLLGAIVTFTHTAGVLVLGVVVLASSTVAPERVLPLLEVASGLLLAAVGVFLLRRALARHRAVRAGGHGHHEHDHDHDHDHGHHDHDHDHDHDHGHHHGHHDHGHDHGHHDHGHRHDGDVPAPRPPGQREAPVQTLAADPAAAPSGTLLTAPPGPAPVPARPHEPSADGTARRLVAVEHDHGLGRHTHLVPDPAAPLGLRTLAAMGVAGGLVPSPSALVVLLGATALGRAWFGVLLVLAYGAGMALTLTAAGLLLLRARTALAGTQWKRARGLLASPLTARAIGVLPVLTAAVIVAVGALLVARGLAVAGTLG